MSQINIPIMSEMISQGRTPEYLFWVGCAGAFDDRYKKVTRAFTKILTYLNVSYACLGAEETCSGDPARRAGNEMLYQMQAMTNISTFDKYQIKKIITICPHCFNIFKNDYPDLGGNYEIIHHTVFLNNLINEGKLKLKGDLFKNNIVTYHDPCYLGRANNEYNSSRVILDKLAFDNKEMPRHKSKALCCGAGGAQMFKEAEKGTKEVYMERTEEAVSTGANIIASSCPFCMVMLTDGLKYMNKEEDIYNYDIAELIAMDLGL